MRTRELSIPGAYEFTPAVHPDDRGAFFEAFTQRSLAHAGGRELAVAQVNTSVSAAGVLRGVHFADVPPGQAKYVTCLAGAVIDLVVDIRVGSPTFGSVATVTLDAREPRAVFLAEGLGHAFVALRPDSTVVYLCSTAYDPGREHGILATDPELGLPLPDDVPIVLSPKDREAPTLGEAMTAGLLPRWDDCLPYLRGPSPEGGNG